MHIVIVLLIVNVSVFVIGVLINHLKLLNKMSKELLALSEKIDTNGTLIDTAIVLLKKLSTGTGDTATDIQALSDKVDAQDKLLSDAINVINTPA